MEIIYLLIPIALLFVAIGVRIFFWAVKDGQFEDLEGPAHSILFEDSAATDEPGRKPADPDSEDK